VTDTSNDRHEMANWDPVLTERAINLIRPITRPAAQAFDVQLPAMIGEGVGDDGRILACFDGLVQVTDAAFPARRGSAGRRPIPVSHR
jgi:hypothetical protein